MVSWWPWREKSNYEKAEEFLYDNKHALLAAGICVSVLIISRPRFWRRIPDADSIPVPYWKKRKTISGIVSRVGDGDGFHLYHRPLFHQFFPLPKPLPQKQISVRIAGVDAPECAHFGSPAQPYGEAARDFLKKELIGKKVKLQVLKRDQYGRCVGMAWVKKTFRYKNVSALMLEKGLATVYVGAGAEYGGMLKNFEAIEKKAKAQKKGMWCKKSSHKESPMDFKKKNKH